MALDSVVNFGKVTVSGTYNATDTSITLISGDGAKLPSTFSYNLVWWNSTDYPDPADDSNKEIIRVTNRVSDTLTVTRAQEGTTATVKNLSGKTYKMILSFTKKSYDDINTHITDNTADDHTQYILIAGTRAFTGNQSLGGFNLTNVGEATINSYLYLNETSNASRADVNHVLTSNLPLSTTNVDGKEMITLKNSNLNHGITSITETDTYGHIMWDHPQGGLEFTGYSAPVVGYNGVGINGIIKAGYADTSKTSSSGSIVVITAAEGDATAFYNTAANANLLTVRDYLNTRFIFAQDGDFYMIGTSPTLTMDDNGFINTPLSLVVNIDTNNLYTNQMFEIGKDRTIETGGTVLFRVSEDGTVLIPTELNIENDIIDTSVPFAFRSSDTNMWLERNNANSWAAPVITFIKSRGDTTTRAIVVDDDKLGTITFRGFDGTDGLSVGAAITTYVDGTPGLNDMPARLVFSTTPDGSASVVDRLVIDNQGNILINTANIGTSAAGVIGIGNGTAPTSSPANMVQLYAEDVAAVSELKVKDEPGNTTTLSPHPSRELDLDDDDMSIEFPFAYLSENRFIGKRVYVNWAKFIRAVEKMTGQKFMKVQDIEAIDWYENEREKERQSREVIRRLEKQKEELKKEIDRVKDKKERILLEKAEKGIIIPKAYKIKDPPRWIKRRLKKRQKFDNKGVLNG